MEFIALEQFVFLCVFDESIPLGGRRGSDRRQRNSQ